MPASTNYTPAFLISHDSESPARPVPVAAEFPPVAAVQAAGVSAALTGGHSFLLPAVLPATESPTISTCTFCPVWSQLPMITIGIFIEHVMQRHLAISVNN